MQAQKYRIGYGMTKAEAAEIRQNLAARASTHSVPERSTQPDGILAGFKKLFG